MSIMDLRIGRVRAAGPAMRSSMFGESIQPMYADGKSGSDLEIYPIGVGIFLAGIDRWGNKKKKVGR